MFNHRDATLYIKEAVRIVNPDCPLSDEMIFDYPIY